MLRSARLPVSFLIPVMLVLASTPGTVAAGQALSDGVVVDAGRGVAYLLTAEGTLEALELGAGKVLWTVPEAAKPLAAADGLVIAQAASAAGKLDLVSFGAESGRPGPVKARVDLPAGVKADLHDGPNRSFRVTADSANGGLVVSWLATGAKDDTLRGYMPAAVEGAAPAAGEVERQVGAVQLDLVSGAVTSADSPASSSSALEALPVATISGATGNLFASADGRHVLESERQTGNDPFQSYRWTVYDRDSGRRLGELTSISSASPFIVADGSLLYVSQRSIRSKGRDVIDEVMQLRAFDLASSKEIWSRAVSDPSFRGPFPP